MIKASGIIDVLIQQTGQIPHIGPDGVTRFMKVHAPAWTALLKSNLRCRIVNPREWFNKPSTEKLTAGEILDDRVLASKGLSRCIDFDPVILRMLIINQDEHPNIFVGMKPVDDELFCLRKNGPELTLQTCGCGSEIDFGIGAPGQYTWIFREI